MHPKAVTLMLAGFEPHLLPVIDSISFRQPGFAAHSNGLCVLRRNNLWRMATASEPDQYLPATWDDVDAEQWTTLPDNLLQRALQGA
ncbi:hypothetical protein [Burkholderia sp. BE12]|uniref:hypothetical protein n=1 Tax=Burkholderia sp. BE12 TaxID=2082394 RepID=UPI000CF38C2C|nr:hypothetical protein [Burkholderia sp. BE12]